ncbi:MAG TPA: helicase-related protein [Tepidisphaeraceae bacterium]|jgi:SNF2 family DNA or RNA helicase
MDSAGAVSLRDRDWDVGYSHEDGDLVAMFFVPALARAQFYQRATGYFSGDVLAMAARGLDALIARGGRMQLLVGCTLTEQDVEDIKKGYDVREAVTRTSINQIPLKSESPEARKHIGYLAWMIAHGYLDVKIAIPLDEHGEMRAGLGLYHAKAGIVVDDAGDKLVFKGSINETPSGWLNNCESFDVSCSWRGEWDEAKVKKTEGEFAKLWAGKAKSARVFDFPEALKEKILEFLPTDDTFVKPPKPKLNDEPTEAEVPAEPVEPKMPDDVRRQLAWAFIKHAPKRPDGAMVAVVTSTVKPWPHQLRAYKRMIDSWPLRLLIADEVGLGKTIEAGLIIRHAWIAEWAKRVLIMAPKGLLKQWQSELYEKFNLLVPIYTGQSLCWPEHHHRAFPLEQNVSRAEWTKQPIVLVSSHLMRRSERQQELIDAEDWDLLVLDEAHHARRKSPGTVQEGGPNRLLKLMQAIKLKAKSLLLMTATPMQVHPVEMWDLLNLLGMPGEWTSSVFTDYFDLLGRNPSENDLYRAALLFQSTERQYGPAPAVMIQRVAEGMSLSKIDVTKVVAACRESNTNIPIKRLTTKQRAAMIAVLKACSPIYHRMSRHTRNLLRQYFKKGLLDSPIADRKVDDKAVVLSTAERELYDAVEDYISTTYQAASPDKKTAVGFVMTIYRRRLASSFYALRKTLESRLARIKGFEPGQADAMRVEEDLPQDEQVAEAIGSDEADEYETKALGAEEQTSIQTLLKGIAKLGTDTKAREVHDQLQHWLADKYDTAIIFTQYTDTMDYLRNYLTEQLDVPVGCYSGRGGEIRDASGNWITRSKEQIKRMLKEKSVKVLVCTDAAGEGLNLQTCGVVINYDLPWNPMKVEQRIGRIDRIGQQYPEIRVVNLAYADTVEADVYFALSQRIGLFNGVIGKLQPILAQLPKEFEAAALRRAEDRDKGRHEAVRNVDLLVTAADAATFDIDEVSDADLVAPSFPPSPYVPADITRLLSEESMLPPGSRCNELEARTYGISLPGDNTPARITADPDIFDDHFESHQLVLPNGPIFSQLAASAAGAADGEVSTIRSLTDLG